MGRRRHVPRFSSRGRKRARVRRPRLGQLVTLTVTSSIPCGGLETFNCRLLAEMPTGLMVTDIEPAREAFAAHGFEADSPEYLAALAVMRGR